MQTPWTETGTPASPLDAALGPLLVAAGREAMSHFRRATRTLKPDNSVVTEADHASERVLVEGLAARFPADAILAEEGQARPGGPALWVVDPLDGTAAFTEGLAYWGPTAGRLLDGRVAAGALWLPRIGEYYFGELGVGAFRGGTRLPRTPWAGGRPGANDVLYVPSRLHAGAELDWPGKARCLGSVATHLCLVAAGAACGALIGPGWRRWDVAAGLALLHQVGGLARLPDGQDLDVGLHEGQAFMAGSPDATAWLAAPGRVTLRRRPASPAPETRTR